MADHHLPDASGTHPSSPPPRLKNRYRLVQWLGEGSIGVVYRAYDETLDREVAIKFFPPTQIAGHKMSERFLREARAVARLTHPHIMALYDVDREAHWHYLVLEYISGDNLQTKLAAQGRPFTVEEGRPIMRALFEALAYAHTQNLIHRDIKPENMMLTSEGHLKVTDFGLALAHGDVRLTKDDMMVGTALYLAPEVVAGQPATHQADLYAAGAVIYELLTGQPPFIADSPVALFSQILNAPLTPPRRINPVIPPSLNAIIIKLLAKDPTARYDSASAVLDALPHPAVQHTATNTPAAAQPRLDPTASLLERIARSTSTTYPTQKILPAQAEDAIEGTPEPPDLMEALLIYAAQEDTVSALELERRRLSMLLQGNLMESLNLLLSQANTYEQTLAAHATARTALSVIIRLIRQTIQEVRDLGDNLHPVTLETLGLEPALESLATQMQRKYGLTITLNVQRMEERLSKQVELALFRAAQEAVGRAVRQAQASQVIIDLHRHSETLQFSVADNGLNPAEGEWVSAIRQRIEQLGGRTEITPQRQGGLLLNIQFPLDPPVDLTPREMEVIQLLTEGLSNKEIARHLSITPRTVNFHLSNLYTKLGVNSRTEAAIYALRQGWIAPPV